jgi:hypothetical protein
VIPSTSQRAVSQRAPLLRKSSNAGSLETGGSDRSNRSGRSDLSDRSGRSGRSAPGGSNANTNANKSKDVRRHTVDADTADTSDTADTADNTGGCIASSPATAIGSSSALTDVLAVASKMEVRYNVLTKATGGSSYPPTHVALCRRTWPACPPNSVLNDLRSRKTPPNMTSPTSSPSTA